MEKPTILFFIDSFFIQTNSKPKLYFLRSNIETEDEWHDNLNVTKRFHEFFAFSRVCF